MKKDAKKVYIIMSVTTLFVTFFAIISLTFSWYIRTTGSEISSITMSAAGMSGIQLSTDAYNWKTELTASGGSADIVLDEDMEFDSISTSTNLVDGNMQFYTAQYGDYGFETNALTEQNYYYTFDFYVLNTSDAAKQITLGYNSQVVDINSKDLAYSTRVAFVKLGQASNSLEAVAIDGVGVSSAEYIWEPNSTTRISRIALYHLTYLKEGKSPYQGVDMEANNLTLTNSLIVNSQLVPGDEVVDVTTHDPIHSGDDAEITQIMANSIIKMRVYIWAEGQDIDCTNYVSGGIANINFSFNSYDLVETEGQYVSAEKFLTPVLANTSDVLFSWESVPTNLSAVTYSSSYIFKISKIIGSVSVPIRTVLTDQTSIDINTLSSLEPGTHYASVRAYAANFEDSDFSNQLTFEVLPPPSNILIVNSVIAWSAVTNAESYVIEAYDLDTQITYTATTSSLSNDLTTLLFNDSITLPTGHEYLISVKTNAQTNYVNSQYSTQINWAN